MTERILLLVLGGVPREKLLLLLLLLSIEILLMGLMTWRHFPVQGTRRKGCDGGGRRRRQGPLLCVVGGWKQVHRSTLRQAVPQCVASTSLGFLIFLP